LLDLLDFDFAFSFAGEDRDVVEDIYNRLSADNIKVFYDFAYQSQMVGKDLYRGLRELYRDKGRYIVCFISEHYAKKAWTNLELTAVKERLMSTFFASDFLIPIIIGDAKMLEDIPNFIGFYTHRSVSETVSMLKDKINSSISENHLISNVNNSIAFICPQICHRLMVSNIDASLTNTNELTISIAAHRAVTYFFSGDTVSQTPCILVTKGLSGVGQNNLKRELFPSFIITWKKSNKLSFSIHSFAGYDSDLIKGQSLTQIITSICSMIENDIGG